MRHLKSFHVFHIAAQSASFTEAAERLCLTHGAVSKQIKVLEQYTGQQLFERKGRQMHLTNPGQLLQKYTETAFNALEEGLQQLKQQDLKALDVSCEPTLTMRWLMPRLDEFYHQTGIDVRLSTAGGPVTLGYSGISLAIRRNDFPIDARYQVTELVDEWIGPVCSPQYWQRYQATAEAVKCLHTQTRPEAWHDWFTACSSAPGFAAPDFSEQYQSFEHFYFSLQAAGDGLGMAIASYPLVADDLKQGRLIAPFGFVRSGFRYVILHLPDAGTEIRTDAQSTFIAWLVARIATCFPVKEEAAGQPAADDS